MDSRPHLDLSLWCQCLSPSDLFLPLGSNVLGGNLFGLIFTYRLMATSTSVCHGHLPSPGPISWSWIHNAATVSSRTLNGDVRVPTQTEGRKNKWSGAHLPTKTEGVPILRLSWIKNFHPQFLKSPFFSFSVLFFPSILSLLALFEIRFFSSCGSSKALATSGWQFCQLQSLCKNVTPFSQRPQQKSHGHYPQALPVQLLWSRGGKNPLISQPWVLYTSWNLDVKSSQSMFWK